MRGYNWSRPISTAVEDEGMRSGALDKWYILAGNRAEGVEREAEELRPKMKLRSEVEGGFVRNLALGRHHRRG